MKKITFSNEYINVSIGKDWFTDCPKSQIVVGKNAKTFPSKVNGSGEERYSADSNNYFGSYMKKVKVVILQ